MGGTTLGFAPGHVHDVTNESGRHALSLHVYSPALTFMTQFDMTPDGLVAREVYWSASGETTAAAMSGRLRLRGLPALGSQPAGESAHGRRTAGRRRADIDRVEPSQLEDLHAAGALVVDIRPERQRAEEGDLGIGVVVERNVLEWRLDPRSGHALPEVPGYDQQVIVVCSEGYASSLAAASLRQLGFTRAADLAGGFRAWQAWRLGRGESESASRS